VDKSELEALLARIDVWLLIFGIVVVVGVAGESFFGIRHWWNSRKLQALQNTENEAQRGEIALLKKEAAALDEKAKREELARIEIEDKVAWRRLSKQEQGKLASKLAPFIPQVGRTWYNVNDLEASTFAADIASALHNAKWEVAEPQSFVKLREGPVPLGTNPPIETGVIVVSTGEARSRAAADALVSELVSFGFDATKSPTIDDRKVPALFINVEHRPEGAQGEAKLRAQKKAK
jgi:hypothetical protein